MERNQTAPGTDAPGDVVEITCDNGKVFSTICMDGTAMVFERTLKSRFHNALWKGSFDIREVGADCDWSPRIFNNQLCWTLPAAQYEARSTIQHDEGGLGLKRSSFPSASMSGLRTAFSGLRAGSSAGSFRTAQQTVSAGVRRRSEVADSYGGGNSGVSKRPRPARVSGLGKDTGAESAMNQGLGVPGARGSAGGQGRAPTAGVSQESGGGGAAETEVKNQADVDAGQPSGGVADMEVENPAVGANGLGTQAVGRGASPRGGVSRMPWKWRRPREVGALTNLR